MAHIRTRARTSGERVYQVRGPGFRPRTFPQRKDALLFKAEMERKTLLGALYQAPPETLGAFIQGHLERKEALGARPSTMVNLRAAAAKLESLNLLLIPQVRCAEVEDLLADTARTAPRMAQMAGALVKTVLRAAEARGQQIDRAVLHLPPVRYEGREPRFLTPQEFHRVASWMPEYVKRIVPIAGLTGLRQGELFDLEDTDLALDRGVLTVRKGKTPAARRQVHLVTEAVTLLREQLLARKPGLLVFPTRDGARWPKDRFMGRYYRPATRYAGLEGVTFHDLRRSYVSLMIRAGVDVRTIAAQVGHADGGAMLLRRYGFLFEDAGELGAAKLDALLRADAGAAVSS